ncbi:nuclear protein MDM1 isoform X2 [Synchiropus splendidus]|uniref:nuclear protein MDM1 isoform X2 n=1 Tax=Synchiropus splendidus TaxID=270530 RepID=UPI00237ECA64|nr:nuclear protein MDM1 isoform X2 [Synchiropus splendidus]
MTVRFKCQSEYQRSFRVHRSRSASPHRCTPLAGLRSDQMGMSREPRLQRRRRLVPRGPPRSVSFLHCQTGPQSSLAERMTPQTAPPAAASKSHTMPIKGSECTSKSDVDAAAKPDLAIKAVADVKAQSVPEVQLEPDMGSQPATDIEIEKTSLGIALDQEKSRSPAKHDTLQPSVNAFHQDAWRTGEGRPAGRKSGQKTKYNTQFSWMRPTTAASPLLTAEQVLFSTSHAVVPHKLDTEYRRSFQVAVPPTVPHARKHPEHERIPLFHIQASHKKRKEELVKRLQPKEVQPSAHQENASPVAPPQRKHRIPGLGEASHKDTPQMRSQVTELRQKAMSYRRRAWGTNFSRDHLSQLLSEHNALWEPADTGTPVTQPSTPGLPSNSSVHSRNSYSVEALDLASLCTASSPRPSVVGSAEEGPKNVPAHEPQTPPSEIVQAWGGEDEEENTDEEEGRLPTPKLKMRPVQRTHHDITTPATGGAILVGTQKDPDDGFPREAAALKEAWLERDSCSPSQSLRKPAKPPRNKSPSPVAQPTLTSPPQHGIRGGLRHADFQHNDDHVSVMSWRSAASCSIASAVLERAQKRRHNFWGKS